MAWTTPQTVVANSTELTAALWNEQVRDNSEFVYNMATGDKRNVLANAAFQVANTGSVYGYWADFSGGSSIGTSGANLPSHYDRWYFYYNYGKLASARASNIGLDVPDASPTPSSMVYKVTTAASPGASSAAGFGQTLLHNECLRLGFKRSNNSPLSLSFWVKSNVTGTYIVNLWDRGSQATVSASYTINTANTWEFKTLTIPNISSANTFFNNDWLFPNTVFDTPNFIAVRWMVGAGANYQGGTLNTSWSTTAAANTRYSGQVNLMATVGNYIKIAAPQLEQGPATPFQSNDRATDELACNSQVYVPRNDMIGLAKSSTFLEARVPMPSNMEMNNVQPRFITSPFTVRVGITDGGPQSTYNVISVTSSSLQARNTMGVVGYTLQYASLATNYWYFIRPWDWNSHPIWDSQVTTPFAYGP